MIPKGWHRLSGCHCEGISKKTLHCRLNKGDPHPYSLSKAINESKISKGQVGFLFDLENTLFSYDGASWSQFFRLNWSSFHGLSKFLEYQGWNRTLDIISYTRSPAKQANQRTSEKPPLHDSIYYYEQAFCEYFCMSLYNIFSITGLHSFSVMV